jgi:hypothetical protein
VVSGPGQERTDAESGEVVLSLKYPDIIPVLGHCQVRINPIVTLGKQLLSIIGNIV